MPSRWIVVKCDYCPADVVWANTGTAMMPVNPVPVPGGNVVLMPRAVGSPRAIVTIDAATHSDLPRYTSHMGNCPGAAEVRRRTQRHISAATQNETLF